MPRLHRRARPGANYAAANRRAGLLFLFNVGVGGLIGTHVEEYINAGNYGMAGDALLEWTHGMVNGQRVELPVLVARREAERLMLLSQLPPEAAA